MRRLTGVAGQLLFACTWAAIGAATPAYAAGDAPTTDRLAIEVSATVMERCGVNPDRVPIQSAELDRPQTMNFQFSVDCNAPFVIGVSSQHGGMRLSTATNNQDPTDAEGFAVEKAYDVALSVSTDDGVLDAGACNSQALTGRGEGCAFFGAVAGEGMSSGGRTAINREGRLAVSWAEADAGPRLAAGTFQDTITVVIGVRP